MSLNSESQLFKYLKGTTLEIKIERSIYNREENYNYLTTLKKSELH